MAEAVRVDLAPHEAILACQVGVRRHLQALLRGLPDAHGLSRTSWDLHIEGAAGEMAAAKALGMYWDGSVGTFSRPDVGRIQVRTRSDCDYDLIVREADADDEAFLLVCGKIPHFRLLGWCYGREGKRSEWLRRWGNRPAAYFVPQSALRPVATILRSEEVSA